MDSLDKKSIWYNHLSTHYLVFFQKEEQREEIVKKLLKPKTPDQNKFLKILEEEVDFITKCDILPGAFKAHYLPLIHRLQSQTKKEIIGINPKSSLDLVLTLMGLAQAVLKEEEKYWNLELHQVVEEFFDFFTEKENVIKSHFPSQNNKSFNILPSNLLG